MASRSVRLNSRMNCGQSVDVHVPLGVRNTAQIGGSAALWPDHHGVRLGRPP